jgi:hypothetical protein
MSESKKPEESDVQAARQYVLLQLATMRKYGSLTGEVQQMEFDEIVGKIVQAMRGARS